MNIVGLMTFAMFLFATIAVTSAAVEAGASGDVFTPVIASTLSPETHAVRVTDNAYHIVYEIQLTNTRPLPATIDSIDVLEAPNASKLITSFSGTDVVKRMRTLAPAPAADAKIGPNEVRLFYIELAFKDAADIPRALEHRLHLLAAASPGPGEPKPLDYVVAHLRVAEDKPVVIGAPLAGAGWLAGNGCCNPEIIHRGSVLSVNGALYDAQRFAIDWMRLDEQGRLVDGDRSDVHSYTCYGAEVLAVADGKVVGMLNDLDDQKPGKLPDPDTMTIDTVDGNHVVLDIGGGYFAFYAHLQKKSVTVRVGDQVKKGAVIGKLGNSGNTSGPSPLSRHDGPVCSRLGRRSLYDRRFQSCRTNRYRGIRGRARSHRELGKRTVEQTGASRTRVPAQPQHHRFFNGSEFQVICAANSPPSCSPT